MKPRTRRTVAVLCIVLVACAVLLPASTPTMVSVEFHPLWLVVPDTRAVIVEGTAACSAEQPVALLALGASRAPPASTQFA